MALIRRNSPLSVPTMLVGGPDTGGPLFTSTILGNSDTLQIGDPVELNANAAADGHIVQRLTAVTEHVVGVVVGFGRADGGDVAFDSGTNDTVTVASDNETSARIYAILDITPWAVWSAPLNADIHTTTRFDAGSTIDFVTGANCDQLNESTITATSGVSDNTGQQAICLGPDPEDTTRGLILIGQNLFNSHARV